jgi:hypothetical protein
MNGVMIANGGAITRGSSLEVARIYDMAPTLLYLSGQSVSDDMDGRVLTEMISADYSSVHPIRFAAQRDDEHTNGFEYSDEENSDVIARLKSLGYVG